MKYPRLGITRKIVLLAVIVVLATAAAVGGVVYRDSRELLERRQSENIESGVELHALRLENAVAQLRQDTAFVAQAPAVVEFVRAAGAGGASREQRARMTALFTGLLKTRPYYRRARLIAPHGAGRELARVEHAGARGASVAAPPERTPEPYLAEALRAAPDEILLSRVALARAHDRLVLPHQPTLRALGAIRDGARQPLAIVAIDFDFRSRFAALLAGANPAYEHYLANEEGDYLEHPDPGRTFGFEVGRRQRLQEDYPALAALFAGGGPRQATIQVAQRAGLLHARRLVLDPGRPGRFLVLARFEPRAEALAFSQWVRGRSVALILAMSLLGALAAAAVARRITRPLRRVTEAAARIAAGDAAALPADEAGEVGQMVRAIEAMTQQLHAREAEARLGWARLEAVVDSTAEAIITVDAEQRIVMYNKGAEAIFGHAAAEVIGQPLAMLLPKRLREAHAAHLSAFAQGREGAPPRGKRRDIVGLRKDGREFPAQASISRLTLDGRFYLTVVMRDVTELRQAQLEQGRLSAIVESTTDLVGTADTQGNMLYMNRAGRRMTGFGDDADLRGLRIPDFHPEWAARKVLDEGLPAAMRDGSWRGETALRARDGRETPVSQVIVAHRAADGGVEYLSSIMRDMSEQQRAEAELRASHRDLKAAFECLEQAQAQLLQSEKMASIGQLAAGVAHEINNPVGYVNSNLGTLRGYIDDLFRLLATYEKAGPLLAGDPLLQAELASLKQTLDLGFLREDTLNLVKESQEGITRVKKIVADLKEFSHVDRAVWQQADLRLGIDSTLNIVHNEIKYKAEIVKDYGELPLIECIPAQLDQVFLNLLVNAAQAIETRGTITLTTGTDGDGVFVEIRDTGQGMPAEVQKRIFEPFFTTKPVGKGTGLGLSLSYGIVQKHHGRIDVVSEPGRGTSFRVWLPVGQGQEGQATEKQRNVGT